MEKTTLNEAQNFSNASAFKAPEFYLSSAGPLAAKIPTFEERRGQLELLKRISSTFEENGIGVFEAGTGVGKSFAYLLPAILWNIEQKERVVISTGTINLQQQLIEKDIPLALEILGAASAVKAVLVKGRQQYLCIRRFLDVRADKTLFSDEEDEIEKIDAWVKSTKDGSRSDLSFMPNESLWTRINSEADACMGAHCMHREECYVMKLKKEAAGAGIIVVNHHLLFADVEARFSAGAGFEEALVLPPYKRLIFDEAHGIEDAATSFFSASFNRFKIQKLLNAIFRSRRGKTGGLLLALSVLSKNKKEADAIPEYIEKVKLAIEKLDFEALEILKDLRSIRLTDKAGFNAPPTAALFSAVFACFAAVQGALTDLINIIKIVLDEIPEDDEENPVVYEVKQNVRRLTDASLFCKTFCAWSAASESHVFYIEKGRFTPRDGSSKSAVFYANFYQTPLEIANKMNEGVFEQMESVICTSATLCAGDTESKESFYFWLNRTGVNLSPKSRVDCGVFASPFPYKENALVCITKDAPLPQENSSFQDYAENAITEFIEAAKGRTLVLFTSFDSLRSACSAARLHLRSSNYTVMCQGEDDRSRLLHNFRKDVSSVLFATDSFWQGIDVQGESLSQVIIVKLPFAVPSDPVFAARSEAIEEKGGSSFMELSVPDAVIKFRQGFGRLIRHSDDRGVITILDKRIIEKRYGQVFLESIPKARVFSGAKKEITAKIIDFLG